MLTLIIDLITTNWLSNILWIGVGMSNGWKDRSALNRFKRAYWNKSEGWLFKWKLDEDGERILNDKKRWYYLWRFTPKYKERFWGSSTAFVFLTDGWHLLQFIQFKLAMASVLIGVEYLGVYQGSIVFLNLFLSFVIGFWITYESKENKIINK